MKNYTVFLKDRNEHQPMTCISVMARDSNFAEMIAEMYAESLNEQMDSDYDLDMIIG